jgi:hypothetical protein
MNTSEGTQENQTSSEIKEFDYIEDLNKELKELEGIGELYIRECSISDWQDERILKDVNIPIYDSGQECGKIDIAEYIGMYMDDIRYTGKPQRVFTSKHNVFGAPTEIPKWWEHNEKGNHEMMECKLTEVEEKKISDFIDKNIKPSGTSDTVIGELFRAFQRIEYRAHNDGDNYFCIGSPSFISYLFIMSTLDIINWSWLYEKEFELENPLLKCWTGDNHVNFEGMLFEIKYIELILIELLEAGVITDRPNEIDSRDFTRIKKDDRDYWNR